MRNSASERQEGSVLVGAKHLQQICRSLLERTGVQVLQATIVADHLVRADLAGHASHGVRMLPSYLQALSARDLNPSSVPEVVEQSSRVATSVIDGHKGLGHPAGALAVQVAVATARTTGVSAVAIVNAGHLGRMGHYVELAAASECALLAVAGGLRGPRVAPEGLSKGSIGSNPIAGGFPIANEDPLVVDMATSAVAAAKAAMALEEGNFLEAPVLVDVDGSLTADPGVLWRGGHLLPMGGHKGFALGLLVEMLSTCLTGSLRETQVLGEGQSRGGLLICLDTSSFREPGEAAASARRVVNAVRLDAEANDQIHIPGHGNPQRYRSLDECQVHLGAKVAQDVANWIRLLAPSESEDDQWRLA